ncbi:MAG: hypothetical protein KGN84_14985, partial [Acidobacteriota bacterium]|nr:hypothetical protein [Acidobacteriota bacterium]
MRHRHAASILGVWLFILCAPAALAQGDFEGKPVGAILWDPAVQPYPEDELQKLIPVRQGAPYRAGDVRAAIENLYATGRFQDIQVDASESDGAVSLRFTTKGNWFIGRVSAKEDLSEPPTEGQIVSAARLDLGTPFDESAIASAETGIRTLLESNGYYGASVSHELDYDRRYQQVNITFLVRSGKRASYATPRITGDTSVLSEKAIDRATHWRRFLMPGYRGITQTRTRAGIDGIRTKYENANHLLATVTLEGIDLEANGRKGRPRISVDPGSVVEIRANGAKVGRKALRDNVPVFEEHTVDADLLTEGEGNLRDYFQARGYFDVRVEYRQSRESDGKTLIDYEVALGDRHTLSHLGISGNKYFDTATIRERMFLIPKSFEFRRGRYSDALRRRDEGSITDLYQANGFRDVKVTSRVVDDYQGHKGSEAVFFEIEEGHQYRVANLYVQGARNLDLTNIVSSLSSQKDQVFSEFNIAVDRETIVRAYGDNGFADAAFEWDSKPGAEPYTVDLTFSIREGEQQFVREVVTSGLDTTHKSLVRKQIDMNPGDPLSPTAMADTQRKLYDLGIFSGVNMALQNPDGDENSRYVLYDLQEARRYSVTMGFGAEFARIGGSNAITDLSDPGGAPGVSPRLSLDMTRLNLFGTGQSLTWQGRLSTYQKRASLSYFVPRILSWQKFDATFSVLYDYTHDVRTFQSIRKEASAQIVQHVS